MKIDNKYLIFLWKQYNRLSIAASITESNEVTPRQLWENTDSIMTDSATKNLKIEDGIAAEFNSTHNPMHLLCKSHTVEKLDSSNLEVLRKVEESVNQREVLRKVEESVNQREVLRKVEESVNQREILEKINPRLKSFFRGKKCTVESGIYWYLFHMTSQVNQAH